MDLKLGVQTADLAAIDQTTLTPLIQLVIGSETVQVVSWEREQLHGGMGLGTAIYRFSGDGQDQGQKVPWSLILKTIRPEGDKTDPSAWNYYKREVDAYQSGWLDDLPGGLAAPRCYNVTEFPDGTCWIWLEDVRESIGKQWPLEHYGIVARHAGQFNGAYLVERSLPRWSWLSSDWLRRYIAPNAHAIPRIRNSLDHPLIRLTFPGDSSERVSRMWEERECYLSTLNRLPQTLCHHDLFRRNLFASKTADGEDQTVAIDWAFVGQGAIGEEISTLVFASIAFHEIDLDNAKELEDVVFEGYLEGLSDAGWDGDPQQVRLGYTAASIRWRFCGLDQALDMIFDEDQHPYLEQVFGCSMEESQSHWGKVFDLVDRLAEELPELMETLE